MKHEWMDGNLHVEYKNFPTKTLLTAPEAQRMRERERERESLA